MSISLKEIHRSHKGKVSDKWDSYLNFYEEVFAPYRGKAIRILEIGIQNGGSLEVWAKYFPNFEYIVGCDIAQETANLTFEDGRISVVVGDANASTTVRNIREICDGFDIIIDDGSHRSGDIIQSFGIYFPMLRQGGIYIAEDLHCSYWQEFQGGIEAPFSSINFFKRIADLVNKEHWGGDLESDAVLDYYAGVYGAQFTRESLDLVAEVRFRNSLCAIRKGQIGSNRIGHRNVVGRYALVEPAITPHIDGMAFISSDQAENSFGPRSTRIEIAAADYSRLCADIARGEEREEKLLARSIDAESRNLALSTTVKNLSRALELAQRRPYALLGRLLQFRVLRALSQLQILPRHIADRLSRGAAKRDPRKVNINFSGEFTRPPQNIFRRIVFHRSGKPRGWFRAVALVGKERAIRPFFNFAFYKKNGCLRPDYAAFLTRQSPSHAIAASRDAEDIPRAIFAHQQAELNYGQAVALIAELEYQPLISIIMPVYNTPVEWLRRAIESLQEQFYGNWELCVVDDCSPADDQRRLLAEMSRSDRRIRWAKMPENGGISSASNMALEMALGEFFALLDHDDELTPDALLRMVEAINATSDVDFLYSDECKIDDTPARTLFHFILKPDWSPEIMLNFMLTGHLTVYRTALVREIGGFRSAYDFSQDYDLALRMAEVSRRIVHVERILYLWRAIYGSAASGGKDFARETNISALADALVRRDIVGATEILPHANRVHIDIPRPGSRVAIIIPSDSVKNLRRSLDSIRKNTDYHDYEVCVVCNSGVASTLESEYVDWSAVRFIRYDKVYNFSDKCNVGARAAESDIVIFYNDDVFPIKRDWIDNLVEYLWVPGVGATSPQLLFENGTIQYAGMISGVPGLVGTCYNRLPFGHVDQFLSMNRLVRNISVLSGACCAIRRDLFFKIGGFDSENTPDGHSDVDLSCKIIAEGLRCVYTPYSLLTHIGNHSWSTKSRKYKADIFCLKRWGTYISRDPYFTDTMRKVLYGDFTFDYRIYAECVDVTQNYAGPDVLFVSHDLTNTGAPHMLFEAAKAVKAAGGFPVVVSPVDGPLRAAFGREGIVVIIDASVTEKHFLFERFARNFDVVVVNTSVLHSVVEQLGSIPDLPTLWWLHESEPLSQLIEFPAELHERVTVICVGAYAQGFLPEGIKNRTLFNGIPDHSEDILPDPAVIDHDRLVFLLLGTIEPRKGQDIFVQAALGLPDEVREKCTFVIAGKIWPHNQTYWDQILSDSTGHSEIVYLGDVPHDRALSLIAGCDVLVACSRDDAFSLVCIEAAQLSKPTILSDHVGAREVLDDSCSYVFASDDVAGLRDCLLRAYENRAMLVKMGQAARQTYESCLTEAVFARNFMEIVDAQVGNQES